MIATTTKPVRIKQFLARTKSSRVSASAAGGDERTAPAGDCFDSDIGSLAFFGRETSTAGVGAESALTPAAAAASLASAMIVWMPTAPRDTSTEF